jgi:peptide/nickel transport system substrate-binding protein
VGVGPYRFVEWETGVKVVLERNPDFSWGPDYAHEGPPWIETLEFRILPEEATVRAGLDAGEIGAAMVSSIDAPHFLESDQHWVYERTQAGIRPYVAMNNSVAPFDDLRVRQAFNLAVDRDSLIKVAAQGLAVPQYGPLSSAIPGYWEGAEFIGYEYDLEKAKALMEEAGWTDSDGDGVLDKDGQPIEFLFKVTTDPEAVRTAEVLKEQYAQLGVELEILQQEFGAFYDEIFQGESILFVTGLGYHEADLLNLMFHPDYLPPQCCNWHFVDDPAMTDLLNRTRTETDAEARQKVVNEAQRYAIEQAYVVPLFASNDYWIMNNRVHDVKFTPVGDLRGGMILYDAWIEE